MPHQRANSLEKGLSPYLPPTQQSHHYLLQLRKKQKNSRGRKATFSLCSIEPKHSLQKLPRPLHRRKVNSIHSLDIRPEESQANPIRQMPSGSLRMQHEHSSSIRKVCFGKMSSNRVRTLEPREERMAYARSRENKRGHEFQNRKVRECMQENEDSFCSKVVLSPCKENKSSNLEHYIRCHGNANSKPLMLKKGKSKSILSIISRGEHSGVPAKTPTYLQLKPSTRIQDSSVVVQNEWVKDKENRGVLWKGMDFLECSSIQKVNDSSFMSDFGKQELIVRLQEEEIAGKVMEKKYLERKITGEEKRTLDEPTGRKKFKLSNKKIKQIFPCDFFQC